MKLLEDLLKNLGKRIVRRKLERSIEERNADINMRLYLAGHEEYTLLECTAINHMDHVYGLVERILPKRYIKYGEESLNKPAFRNYTNEDHS